MYTFSSFDSPLLYILICKTERFKIMQWSLNILFYFSVCALGKSLGWFICTRPFQQSHREQPISRAPLRRQYLTSWLSIDKYWSLLLWQEASGKTWDVYLLCWILILSLSKLSNSPSQTDLLCFFRSRPCDALFQLWFSFLSNWRFYSSVSGGPVQSEISLLSNNECVRVMFSITDLKSLMSKDHQDHFWSCLMFCLILILHNNQIRVTNRGGFLLSIKIDSGLDSVISIHQNPESIF